MKKRNILITALVIIAVILLVILVIDLLMIREKKNVGVDYTSQKFVKAYSLEDSGESLYLTTYQGEDPMRTVRVFHFYNDKLTAIEDKYYYKTKLNALLDLKVKKANDKLALLGGNMIYCRPQEETYERGRTKEEILNEIQEYYGNSLVKVQD